MTNREAINHINDIICENNTITQNIATFELEKEALKKSIVALEFMENIDKITIGEICDFKDNFNLNF